ncbi:CbbBc protein [Hyphomicrobium nitrativorans NL23]|uniref:CbbBc protein n=1 Tax=Hyphomicrobium nitrativorans NL23 TaxID=1029756 RepID=V5SGT3_9HYPH|nr:FdhF/YdeP family oxidoreductase [Hyphomicrobium nitrativorans]AHB49245.1 CbbBc protein [Hyphomicrobium nitrativorans NL23]
MSDDVEFERYDHPAGGWGSVKSLVRHSTRQGAIGTAPDLLRYHNKPKGYMCTSCAWAKPAVPHNAEFCENGAKATFWELTSNRATPEFFAGHSVSELLGWSDFELENEGRLTHPMRYDRETDRYRPVSWDEAFRDIGTKLKAFDPESVVFYASGRASLETSYMYQLFARLYGNNNLPDSSNMCHETTSVALPESIGTPVGTVLLEDFEATDCIFAFGQNVGTNSPRLLHSLQEARERGARIVVFNPLREKGWEEFVNPQRPGQMIAQDATRIATQYYQVRAGGDIAALIGVAKALFDWDGAARKRGERSILDVDFIGTHTHGFETFRAFAEETSWADIEQESGLNRASLEAAAKTYSEAKSVIAVYGMGLTQHRLGVHNVQMLVNLLLLRGNIGRPGAGICPVRGHSNVQGQRTVGIADKTELVPLDRLAEQYGFSPPRKDGRATIETCEGVLDGTVRAFVGLGGNFVRAAPEHGLMEPAWTNLDLSVQIATKLNRTHLLAAKTTYLLPCLSRLEIDEQKSGPQIVTIEDSTTCIHASRGIAEPASEHLLSEPKIIAEIAKATLPPNPKVPWDAWVDDYGLVRDAIEETYPDQFRNFNERLDLPGGFPRPVPARDRIWETDTKRANFKVPKALCASFDDGRDGDVLRLITLRSNDQFNTTIYGDDDRFRGIYGSRMVVMMNKDDMLRFGISQEAEIALRTAVEDGVEHRVAGFAALEYDIPPGNCAAYFPECNPLVPLWQFAEESRTPAVKSLPVRIEKIAPVAREDLPAA